ncbi:MurR/RpiR family transcriptional regulator [Acinetobacter pittii]|uniref:MurR/RpiR family transcriptional regulator n=1 Tax=Acinetobacter pittii TaxID=48296 RepID=UPI001EFD49A6|nr:MurR/RpiR family transcriptional regulator [Acinetobacter pittii]MCG9494213.1 MurR/RpiR family transcriptional regulator [Acinetobacter pittii]
MQTIHQKILALGQSLTESETRLAQIMLENIPQLASYSATELAKLAGVSKATAVRFFKRLGYASFNDLRMHARQSQDTASPLHLMMLGSYVNNELNYAEQHATNEMRNIAQSFEQISIQQLKQATQLLKQAQSIYVIGFRSCSHLAQYMWYLLNQIRSNAILIQNNNGAQLAEELAGLTEHDLVLMMDYRRRVTLIEPIAAQAFTVQAKILRFTDLSSPDLSVCADLTLRTFTRSTGMFDSYTAANSLINAICTQLAVEQRELTQARLNKIEQLHQHYQDLDR